MKVTWSPDGKRTKRSWSQCLCGGNDAILGGHRSVRTHDVCSQLQESCLLPEVTAQDRGKICVVIDLDETLVHSSFKVPRLRLLTCDFFKACSACVRFRHIVSSWLSCYVTQCESRCVLSLPAAHQQRRLHRAGGHRGDHAPGKGLFGMGQVHGGPPPCCPHVERDVTNHQSRGHVSPLNFHRVHRPSVGLCLVQVIQDRLVHTGLAHSRLLVSGSGRERRNEGNDDAGALKMVMMEVGLASSLASVFYRSMF